MLVSAQTTIAVRCPGCGKVNLATLSRFAVKSGKTLKVVCECGFCLMLISEIKGEIYLQTECVMCDTKHLHKYKPAQLWKGGIFKLMCEKAGSEIGFIGRSGEVKEAVQNAEKKMQEIADQFDNEKYFLNPGIMNQVLDLLQKMSEERRINCACGGGKLEAEAFHDRVEISCPHCGAVGIIFGETVKDLQCVKDMKDIQLEAYTYCYLDDRRLRKRGSSRNWNN